MHTVHCHVCSPPQGVPQWVTAGLQDKSIGQVACNMVQHTGMHHAQYTAMCAAPVTHERTTHDARVSQHPPAKHPPNALHWFPQTIL